MNTNSKNAIEYIAIRYEELGRLSAQEKFDIIRDEVMEKFDFILSGKKRMQNLISELRSKVGHVRRDLEESGANKEDFEKPSEQVVLDRLSKAFGDDAPETVRHEGKVFFKFSIKKNDELTGVPFDEPLFIPADVVDSIVFDYVSHGENLSQQEVVDKYGLSGKAWNAIKSRINLTKLSDAVTNATLDALDDDERADKIDDVVKKHIDSRYKNEFKKTHERQMKSKIAHMSRMVGQREYFLEQVSEAIEGWKPLPELPMNVVRTPESKVLHVFISDIHRGKLGTATVDERLAYILGRILASDAHIVNITCLGDLVEALVQGGMHGGQIETGMDYMYGFGFDLMLNTVNKFQDFLYKIYQSGRAVTFDGIGGNHDRLGKTQMDDVQMTGALVMYEMLKRWLSNTEVQVNYHRDIVSTIKRDGICYLVAHGYGNFDKRNPSDLILAHGDPSMYNVIISGDKHHLNMKEGLRHTWIKTPALAGKGKYDTDNGFYSEPGYVEIVPNDFGSADITIRRLKQD